jgi:NAD(P)H-flavin reductase/hemoglobin-like flavoprotein
VDDERSNVLGPSLAKVPLAGAEGRRRTDGLGENVVDAAGLEANWHAVARYGDQVPLFFYSTLFLTHPETRDMFPVSMAAQRDRLVTALGSVVAGIGDVESLVPGLRQLGRDHRKFGVVRAHYPAVGSALLATVEHFSGDAWTDALARDWAVAYELVAGVMAGAADAASDETPPWWDAEVVRAERRTVDVTVLRLRPNYRLDYRAGQSLAVESPLRPRLWRYYSPATLPGPDGTFELHVRLVPGGPVSTALVRRTQAGDVLRLGPPVGHALTVPAEPDRPLLLIAGGTGLAPMKAIVEQVEAAGGDRPVRLVWGVRRPGDLYDLPALAVLAGRNASWLRIVPCVSDVASGPRDPPGAAAVGTAVEVALADAAATGGRDGPEAQETYVCGSPAMVDGTLAALARAGLSLAATHVEQFGAEEASP